ncbi:MAG: hypothetical protein HWE18_11830 [Gammaproteobacteria bacterium]|nr:hypothetical protein [Gammaproteobacteria bacterium]
MLIGVASSAIWYRLTHAEEQKQKNKQVISMLTSAIQETHRIANQNLSIVKNEIKGLEKEVFTLDPQTSFIPTPADLLLLISNFKQDKSIELWCSLKKIDSLSSQAEKLAQEASQLRKAIKLEDKTHIYLFELLPYLKHLNLLHESILNQIINESQTSEILIDKIQHKQG